MWAINRSSLYTTCEKLWKHAILMVEWLFKLRIVIEQTIIDLKWTTFVNTLHGAHHHNCIPKAKYVWANTRRDGFWDTCANFVHMVKPNLNSNYIKGIRWQTTHHEEGMACHEDIGMKCFIIMRSTILTIIKPCRCSGRSFLLITIDGRCWHLTYIM